MKKKGSDKASSNAHAPEGRNTGSFIPKKNLRMKKNYSPLVAYPFQFSFLSSFLLDGKSQPFCDIKYPSPPRFPLSFLPSAHKKERRKSAQEEVFGVWFFFGWWWWWWTWLAPWNAAGGGGGGGRGRNRGYGGGGGERGGGEKSNLIRKFHSPLAPSSLPLPTRSNEIAEVSKTQP